MAATKRQKAADPRVRKRGRYGTSKPAPKAKGRRAKAAVVASGVRAPSAAPTPAGLVEVTAEQYRGWVDDWVASSPVEHEGTRRTLAEALADARRVNLELGSRPTDQLTDGQSRLLLRALREVRELAKALGTDRLKKKKRAQQWSPGQDAAPAPLPPAAAPEVTDGRTSTSSSSPAAPDRRGPDRVAGVELSDEGRPPVVDQGPNVGEGGAVPPRVRLADLLASNPRG